MTHKSDLKDSLPIWSCKQKWIFPVAFRMIFALVAFLAVSVAHADGWRVDHIDGDVEVTIDGTTWQTATLSQELPNSSWVRTGSRSRLVLSQGTELIIYRPNTLAAVTNSQSLQNTQISLRRGAVLMSVTPRGSRQVDVLTPHLVAVVKGTVFEVTVDTGRSTVRVDKGVVETRTQSETQDIRQGQQVTVDPQNGSSLRVTVATTTALVDAENGKPGISIGTPRPIAKAEPNGGNPVGNTTTDANDGSSNENSNGNANYNANNHANSAGISNVKPNANSNTNSNANSNASSPAISNAKPSVNRNANSAANSNANSTGNTNANSAANTNANSTRTGSSNGNRNGE